MGSFGRNFAIVVVVLDLLAVVYFAGNYIATGHILTGHGHPQNEEQLAALLPAPVTETTTVAVAEPVVPAGPIIGDPTRGAAQLAKCKACHTFDKGGKNMIGPNMWGIVGNKINHIDGFAYSAAFLAKAGLVWNEENLDKFLESPKAFIPGTKMAFPGIRNPQDRADLIAHLKTLK